MELVTLVMLEKFVKLEKYVEKNLIEQIVELL